MFRQLGNLEQLIPPPQGNQPQAVVERCRALGLSIDQARRLASMLSATDPHALARSLGLDTTTLQPLKVRRWLWMAAQSSSVSYRGTLTEDELEDVLITGNVPVGREAHVGHFVDEVPIQVVVMAIEQVALRRRIPIGEVWAVFGDLVAKYSDQGKAALWLEVLMQFRHSD